MIYLLADSIEMDDNKKMVHVQYSIRPTFKNFFAEINKVSKPDDISVIANSDIFFGAENIELIKNNLKENECYALSRWDVRKDGSAVHFNRRDSFDTWAFNGKIKPIEDCDFTLGVAGCDDSIAERIQRAGYTVKNPSIDIRTFHLHLSGIRNYKLTDAKTPKPYLLITPHAINEKNIIYHTII